MAKSEVVTLRISEETKEQLKKVFGEDVTTSDMIRSTISTYLYTIEKAEKGIGTIELPFNILKGDDLKKIYNDICELELKVTENIIKLGYEYDLEYLKVIQKSKNSLIEHMSIEYGSKENKKSLEELNSKLQELKSKDSKK